MTIITTWLELSQQPLTMRQANKDASLFPQVGGLY